MGFIKGIFNALADPRLFFLLAVRRADPAGVEARKDRVEHASATGCSACWAAFFLFGTFDPNFRLIVTKPDNVPIVGLIFLLVFFTWYSIREAVLNDRRIAAGQGPIEKAESDRVWVWPDLVYTELISLILCSVVLIVWSIFLKAPLEQPANRSVTPNPSKAPWYFLGLQEMLVYFDPWLAGVVLPGLIIVGLIAIPYIDKQPEGERLLHVHRAQGGDHALPVRLRHPLVVADRARHVPARPELELLRAVRVLGHPQARGADQRQSVRVHLGARASGTGLPTQLVRARDLRHPAGARSTSSCCRSSWRRRRSRPTTRSWAAPRFYVGAFLFLMMMSLPIKMLLRWIFNLKYIVAIPEFFFNI